MAHKPIRVAIMGAQERDLPVLGTLHNRADVEIAFVYDRDRRAVGIDIAEILNISRHHSPDQLTDLRGLDYAVISEPREKFAAESEILARAGVKLLNPSEVFQQFAPAGRKGRSTPWLSWQTGRSPPATTQAGLPCSMPMDSSSGSATWAPGSPPC